MPITQSLRAGISVLVLLALLPHAAARQPWDDRLAALAGRDWATAFSVATDLASLPPDEGYAILERNWGRIGEIVVRQQLLKGFFYTLPYPLTQRLHARLLDVLHLGMNDPEPRVRQWAIQYLRQIAFREFVPGDAEYAAWYQAARATPVAEVSAAEARRAVAALINVTGPSLTPKLAHLQAGEGTFRDVTPVRVAALQAGFLPLAEAWLADPATPLDASVATLDLLGALVPGEPYQRRVVLPLAMRQGPMSLRAAAVRALASPASTWAVEPLLEVATACLADEDAFRDLLPEAARTLGRIGDKRAIPTLIAVIAADDTAETIYGVGWFGLNPLTGVEFDESHDGAWWRQWWDQHRASLPEAVRDAEIPVLERKFAGGPVGVTEVRAGNAPSQRFYLIGPRAGADPPQDGWKLLVVLPGGDGSADFLPFVRRIAERALPAGYVVAQAIAPQWTDDPERVVWPTRGLPDPRMKFPTEDFIASIVRDVQERMKINPRHVFLMGWSSGGPPCYAASVTPGIPVTGVFVAMSVFKPAQMPDLAEAGGKAYYLLHSPQDFISMRFPEAAAKQLAEAGAAVHLQPYEGGHGWHGDVTAMIRAGVEWLESRTAPRDP